MIIAPSILASDLSNLQQTISLLDQEKHIWIHLDIMDGHFVPNLTFGAPLIERIKSRHYLDAHLMVTNPFFYLNYFATLNIYNITFHYESFNSQQEIHDCLKKAKKIYKSVGLSIKPYTDISVLIPFLNELDIILIMSVEPGFCGQKFNNNILRKITILNKLRSTEHLNFLIEVDGGINKDTAPQVQDVDILVAASYIFQDLNNDPALLKERIASLKKS